jgi:selenocysteine-specific elongation factor
VIVATAGHIDHGKTALVKALTGVDTDRLPQEKARGISIDLGFAYWSVPGGAVVGFVDVPGHERFVRNMLAGVCAIDAALLVVAADDGVMPQTREHLHILDLLAVREGLVVITKCDRAEGARLAEVRAEVGQLLEGSSLAGAELLAVSALTGAGLDVLRERLAALARARQRAATGGCRFRYAVDRAFTRAGSGTVVTGTVFDGAVAVGDRLLVSPGGRQVRVRAIQKQGAAAARAEAGERCALNLAGIERAQVERGDWVLDPQLHAPAARLDVELRLLDSEAHPLRHWTPVHLHLGTREVTARVSLRRGESLPPGQRSFARLVLDRPVVAAHGDRFILRDQSARRTVGGGRVLDADPPRRRLAPQAWARRLQALAAPSAADALAQLLPLSPSGVAAAAFARNYKLDAQAFEEVLRQAGAATVGSHAQGLVLARDKAQALAADRAVPPAPENPEHTRLWQLALGPMRAAGRAGITVQELARAIAAKELVLREALHRKAQAGEAVRVGEDRYYPRAILDDFVQVARSVAAAAPAGRFTAGQFRDAAGIGRALAVQVLEAIDRLGLTRRVGDVRVLRAPANPLPPVHGGPPP